MSKSDEIVLARGLHLPRNAVTQKFAFVARSGAGKTYAAGRLAEQMHDMGSQIIVLDPIGNWYGLRINEAGDGPGISIPVIGGHHADIPLSPDTGRALAKMLVERRLSAVIDVSLLRKNQRKKFMTELVEEFYDLKKLNKGPVHFFIEEAHVFAPQRTQKGEERMLGAFEDLCRLGRNFGIGYSLISQRPQSINKDVLNQVECLVALQTTGPHERKALKEWIVDQGADIKLVDDLPQLDIGEAFVWSPQWLKILNRVKILKKRTLDASATPEYDESGPNAATFADIDLNELRDALKGVIEDVEKEDPKTLRKRIFELEAENKHLKGELAMQQTVKHQHVALIVEEDVKALKAVQGSLETVLKRMDDLKRVQSGEAGIAEPIPAPKRVTKKKRAEPINTHAVNKARKAALNALEEDDGKKLKKGAREILKALAMFKRRMTRSQVAMVVGIKSTGSTFTSYLSLVRKHDFIVEFGTEALEISPTGEAYLKEIGEYPQSVTTHDEIVQKWKKCLKKGARDMLDYLISEFPRSVFREELASVALGIDPSGSTFTSYLSQLSVAGLIEKQFDGKVLACRDLWPENVNA